MGADTFPPCPICGRQPKLLIYYDDYSAPSYTLICHRQALTIGHRVEVYRAPDEFVAAKRWRKLVGKRDAAGGSA